MHAGLSNALSATFLALLVACIGRVLARRPAILHCLWLLVLLKLVTPPLYEIPISWPETLSASREAEAAIGDGGSVVYLNVVEGLEPVNSSDLAAETPDFGLAAPQDRPVERNIGAAIAGALRWLSLRWKPIVGAIWLAGTLATLVISVRRILRFQVLLREATPAADDLQDWVDRLSASLGVRRVPQAWWIGGKLSPMLWAIGGCPRLIIPIELWKSLDRRQRGTLLVHELAHLRRGDHRVRIFELAVTALYWWNPVLWWVRQALRDVEEQCCDAWVVWAFPEAAKSYAETLLETLDFLNQSELSEPLLASGFGKVHHLRRRLTMIMSGSTPRLVSLWGALGALSLGALLLPVNATWAQKPEEHKEVVVIVKTDDDSAKVSKPTETIDVGGTVMLTDQADDIELKTFFVAADDVKPVQVVESSNFNFVYNTDGASISISADSADEAIKKIKDQIKAITDQKAALGDKEKAQQEALLRVLDQLQKIAKDSKQAQSDPDSAKSDGKTTSRFTIRQVDDVKTATASPEKKAQIDKARARIKELSTALAAAQTDLAKLEGHGARPKSIFVTTDIGGPVGARYRVAQPKIAGDDQRVVVLRKRLEGLADSNAKAIVKKLDPKMVQQEITIGTDDGLVPNTKLHVMRVPATKNLEADRIGALETKLNKLLEEVASLKKERSK